MRAALVVIAFLVAACGADGPPVAPEAKSATGMSLTGTVATGLARDGG